MPRAKIKTAIVTLRMPPRTKETLREMAAKANMTLTDYLCICGLGKKIVQVNGLDAVLSELKAQDEDLNKMGPPAKPSEAGSLGRGGAAK